MALINCDYYSKVLNLNVSATVFLPSFTTMESNLLSDEQRFEHNRKFKTLTLLHGFSGDNTVWYRKTRMETYAEEHQLAILCPSGYKGHYTDWETGEKYLSFLEMEFLPAMQAMFPLSKEREDNFVGGASMGGYGAAKWALTFPQTFSHFISFSGGVDILPRIEHYKKKLGVPVTKAVFGDLDHIKDSEHDIFHLLKENSRTGGPLPRIYACCGDDDLPVKEANRNLVRLGKELGYDVTAFEGPGKHDFQFWDKELEKVISQWLPVERYK